MSMDRYAQTLAAMMKLQSEHDTSNASHAEVCATLEAAQARVAELEAQLLVRDQRAKNFRADYIETRKNIEAALRELQP